MNYSNRCSPEKFKFAAKLRRKMTRHERRVHLVLNGWRTGHYWRSQCVIYGYIVDFYCHNLKLIVEVDGSSHFNDDGTRTDYDKKRSKDLSGFTMVHVTNELVEALEMRHLVALLEGYVRHAERVTGVRPNRKRLSREVKRHAHSHR